MGTETREEDQHGDAVLATTTGARLMREIAETRVRYGYFRIHVPLRYELSPNLFPRLSDGAFGDVIEVGPVDQKKNGLGHRPFFGHAALVNVVNMLQA